MSRATVLNQKVNELLQDYVIEVTIKGKLTRVIPFEAVYKVLCRLPAIKTEKADIAIQEKLNNLNSLLDETLRKKSVQTKAPV